MGKLFFGLVVLAGSVLSLEAPPYSDRPVWYESVAAAGAQLHGLSGSVKT